MDKTHFPLLANIAWHALDGPQSAHAAGTGGVRRYAQGLAAIVAFEDPARPDFASLAACCGPSELLHCNGWSGPAPPGWRIDAETTLFKMVWDGDAPPPTDADPAHGVVRLTPTHAAQALELATSTRPGPFGPRSTALGEYFGFFDGPRLVAMAGERMFAGGLREVSGVCTHPDFQGRGLARRLVLQLVRRQLGRGETPFLHVMRENTGAHALYERMGFRDRLESTVRIISRC